MLAQVLAYLLLSPRRSTAVMRLRHLLSAIFLLRLRYRVWWRVWWQVLSRVSVRVHAHAAQRAYLARGVYLTESEAAGLVSEQYARVEASRPRYQLRAPGPQAIEVWDSGSDSSSD